MHLKEISYRLKKFAECLCDRRCPAQLRGTEMNSHKGPSSRQSVVVMKSAAGVKDKEFSSSLAFRC